MKNLPDFLSSGEVARLIPVLTSTRKEQHATSILLSAMMSVKEFRQSLLSTLSVRVGERATLTAWTEVVFKDDTFTKGRKPKGDRPDGLLLLDTGKNKWKALVEAKTDKDQINENQLKKYLELAKKNKLDAVITISNQFVAVPSHHPVKISKNLIKNLGLYHWSWMYCLTQASLLLDSGEIESSDQQYILDEVVRYLSHKKSGLDKFTSMNSEWKGIVNKVKNGANLKKSSEEVENTVSSWHQEQKNLCLILSKIIGHSVAPKLNRNHRKDPLSRLNSDIDVFVNEKLLKCTIDVPDAASNIELCVDVATRTIKCSMTVNAPSNKKRSSARIKWLTRQLTGIETSGISIKAIRGRGAEDQESLEKVIKDERHLISENSDSVPVKFEVFYLVDLAGKFSGRKVFVEELEKAVPHFYEQVGQKLRAWVPPPPKVKHTEKEASKVATVDFGEKEK